MDVTGPCPRHPKWPAAECPVCERLIEAEQDRGENWPPEFPHPDQERYERWLGEIAP